MAAIIRNYVCICLCLMASLQASAINDSKQENTKNLAETFLDSDIGRLIENVDPENFEATLDSLIESPVDSVLLAKTFSIYASLKLSGDNIDSGLKKQLFELTDFYEQQKNSGTELSEFVRIFIPYTLGLFYYDSPYYNSAKIYLKEAKEASSKDSYFWRITNIYLYRIALENGEIPNTDIEDIMEAISDPDIPLISRIFKKINLADIFYQKEEYDKALEIYDELVNDLYNYKDLEYYAISNFLDITLTSLLKYAETNNNHYLYKARNNESFAYELYEQYKEKDASIDFRFAWNSLFKSLLSTDPNNTADIADLITEADNFCKYFHHFCHDNIPTLTKTELTTFYISRIAPIISYIMPCITQMAESFQTNLLMYQFLLDTRGLQLKCSQTLSDIITKSGTPEIKDVYDEYVSQKMNLEKAKISGNLTTEQYDIMKRNIDHLNRQLVDWQKDNGYDVLGWMNTYVDHIQNKLGSDEIAIETFTYDMDDQDPMYCGLAITNENTWPVLFDIISESDFKTLESSPQVLGEKIWKNFCDYLPELKRIYFVPCGRMVNYPIELCTDSLEASKDIEIIRLSSTREILDSGNRIPKRLHAFGVSEYHDDILQDLPGARKEVNDIAKLFPKSNRIISLDRQATESGFKNLSGSGAELIHVAAHGYYNNPGNRAENALGNCGIVLSEYTNDNMDNEDGLLSGEEISMMHLGNVDLVALSSCNSGNAVATEEGAYGLQRAFKLAGVKSILMSLREVKDDGPTKIFMHNFYRSYLSDGDKYKAYRTAVRAVRKRFSDIADWGAFVLIDP